MTVWRLGNDLALMLTMACLIYAAVSDLREYKIRNGIIIVLVGLFFVHTALAGEWARLAVNVSCAITILLISLLFYWKAAMGGGDVKILAVAFLWAGLDRALLLTILLLIFVVVHAVIAMLGWTAAQGHGRRLRIPFAPAVAAALIGTLLLSVSQ